MFSILLVTAVDSHLGRVDLSTLSDQTLAELLIDGFSDEAKKTYQDENGVFFDVCEWPEFECDADGRVTRLRIMDDIGGTIDFSYVPPKCAEACLDTSDASGKLETSALPACLEWLTITQTYLDGTVDFTSLPRKMTSFNGSANEFTGSAVLESLPDTLEILSIFENQFSGTLCLTNLPPRLSSLSVFENKFTGKFHLENACDKITVFASNNAFSSEAIVQKCINYVGLGRSGVDTVFDENGSEHPAMGRRVIMY